MRKILAIVATMLASLLLIAGAIFALDDRSIFTAPPESVAEGFIREVISERYERAIPYLESELAEHITADSIRAYSRALRSRVPGEILDVRGEHRAQGRDTALAIAEIEGDGGNVDVEVPLRFVEGTWKVVGLGGAGRGF